MAPDLTTLGLRGASRSGGPGQPFLLDALLDLFRRVVLPDDVDETGTGRHPAGRDLTLQFDRSRAALREATSDREAVERGHELLALCDVAAEACLKERAATKAEVASLVVLVRDAVRAIAGEGEAFSSGFNASIERFDALSHVTDLRELKAKLAEEVHQLKAFAGERESRWKAMEGVFEQRIEQLSQQLADTQRAASFDPLTGAANRRAFEQGFAAMLATGSRDVVLAMFDVDNFKQINDTLGHSAGDRVLVAVADAITAVVRTGDVVSRFGGDEFAVLMSGITLRQAEHRLRSTMTAVAATVIGPRDETPATLSCGAAELSAGDTLEALMARADQALYDAKRAGKGRIMTREAPYIHQVAGRSGGRR